jgi:hypothetical protein
MKSVVKVRPETFMVNIAGFDPKQIIIDACNMSKRDKQMSANC